MLNISQDHRDIVEDLVDHYGEHTEVPMPQAWKEWEKEDLWINFIKQVMVVGGSSSYGKLFQEGTRDDLWARAEEVTQENLSQEEILREAEEVLEAYEEPLQYWFLASWESLSWRYEEEGEEAVRYLIYTLLRMCGTRYVSKNLAKGCRKTEALVHNFLTLYHLGGPEKAYQKIAHLPTEKARIDYLMNHFHYFGPKSTRDFLMEAGLVRNAIAFDVRIYDLFYHVIGLDLPDQQAINGDPYLYEKVEGEILENICKPLNIEGVFLDRLFYQYYYDILSEYGL